MAENNLQETLNNIANALETQRARNEIYDCLVRFYRGVDRLDRDMMLSAYHPGARDNHGIFDGPAEDFVDWVIKHLTEKSESTVHHIGNVMMNIEGKVAYCETYCFAIERHRVEGALVDFIAHGRLLDRFEERGGAWRIAERHLVADWQRIEPVPPADGPGLFVNMLHAQRSREDASYAVLSGETPA